MNILLVAPVAPPHGGMATSTAAMVKAVRKWPEHSIRVVDISVRWRKPMRLNFCGRLVGGALHAADIYRRLVAETKYRRPDVVEIANCGGIGPALRDAMLLRVLRRRGIPTVLCFRTGRFPALLSEPNLEARLVNRACAAATSTVVLDGKSALALKNLPARPWVFRRANFIDVMQINAAARQHASGEAERDVLYAGWLYKEKGIFELANAIRELPDVTLRYAGPAQPGVTEQLFSAAGPARARVEILGPVAPERVYALMSRSKMVALPSYSRFEAFPNVILEAMALQRPVIATGIAAVPEMLGFATDAPAGRQVEMADHLSLRAAVAELAADASLRQMLGRNGSQRVGANYVEDSVVPKMLAHWAAVAERRVPRTQL